MIVADPFAEKPGKKLRITGLDPYPVAGVGVEGGAVTKVSTYAAVVAVLFVIDWIPKSSAELFPPDQNN